ncbi:hypothetical protein HPB51_013435 [Rhipicephalus microplus]|uniref:Choline transporter-like protein n=1 Tax=Rhipicephalus microplus TaxID=6941 RepID=A0A9J6EGT5_RHIMP|nr:hypothetical protein HPB51_013435 [Rhipicephalus microplus]
MMLKPVVVAMQSEMQPKLDFRAGLVGSREVRSSRIGVHGPVQDFNKTLSHLRCQFTQYVANQHLSRLQIYNFIGLIWGMFFIVGLGQVALAAAFASYYWAFRKPQDVPFFAVLHGLWITVRHVEVKRRLIGIPDLPKQVAVVAPQV